MAVDRGGEVQAVGDDGGGPTMWRMEPMADGLVLPPDGGEALTIRGGSTLLFAATAGMQPVE
jgi:hypothetical protein